jgi:outer membrane lipoprotein-sorting protein
LLKSLQSSAGARQSLVLIAMGLALLSSCSSKSNQSSAEPAAADQVVSSTPPFQTKEPERYQALRTITLSKAAGEIIVTRTLVAKDGNRRRDEYRTGTTEKIVYLDLPDGRFILLPAAKLYADVGSEAATSRDSPDQNDGSEAGSPDLLLNADRIETQYQKLGSEIINGRNTDKYRVLVNTSARGNVSTGESFIWIDETLGMPIKSETVTTGNRMTMELSEIVLDVNKGGFQIPGDYKKVSAVAIRERLHQQ